MFFPDVEWRSESLIYPRENVKVLLLLGKTHTFQKYVLGLSILGTAQIYLVSDNISCSNPYFLVCPFTSICYSLLNYLGYSTNINFSCQVSSLWWTNINLM